MFETDPHFKYRVTLEPLTPIHVWSGVRGFIRLDVVLDSNKQEYCVVNLDQIELKSEEVRDLLNLRSSVQSIVELAYKEGRLKCRRKGKLAVPQIPGGVKDIMLISDLLVPGSTIKGYIRTAILTYLLYGDWKSGGNNYIAQIINKTVNLSKPKFASQDLETHYLRAPRGPKGFVDSLQMLWISDPIGFEKIGLCVRDAYVYDIAGNLVATVLLETLDQGSLEYELHIRELSNEYEKFLKKHQMDRTASILKLLRELEELDFFKVLCLFAKNAVEAELDVVKRVKKRLLSANIDLSQYEKLLNELLKHADSCSGSCIPVRLGFMTGHMSKTVDWVIKSAHPSAYQKVCDVMSQALGRPWDSATIKLVKRDGSYLGIGWAKLCLS